VSRGDRRGLAGRQGFVAAAPVNRIYVSRAAGDGAEQRGGIQAGLISENVHRFCASEGLATVVRAMVDREPLAKALQLSSTQRIILAQTVGYPQQPQSGP